jgi:glycosyltransferase involved in cell wall biosynthesis
MRVLWLKTDLLHPLDRGGRIRSYHMLREIAREHEVHYLALDDGSADGDARARAREYAVRVELVPFRNVPKDSPRFAADLVRNFLGRQPYAIDKYASPILRRRVGELVTAGAADLVVADFLMMAPNVPAGLPVPTVLFQHNVEAEIWRRHAATGRDAVRRAYFRDQWHRMRRLESDACRAFDHVIAVSEHDAALLRRDYDAPSVSWVPTGVDVEYFAAATRAPRPGRLLFLGSLDWMPNEDAIAHLLGEILPLVRSQVPAVTLDLVGRKPRAALRERAAAAPGVALHADVPDVRPHLGECAVFVVPLRVGGGTRLKLYEAMAAGLPVVSTRVGAEGLPVRDGEHLVIADSAEAQADAIAALLQDPARAARLGAAAAAFVSTRFSWRGVAHDFMQQCEATRPRFAARRRSAA